MADWNSKMTFIPMLIVIFSIATIRYTQATRTYAGSGTVINSKIVLWVLLVLQMSEINYFKIKTSKVLFHLYFLVALSNISFCFASFIPINNLLFLFLPTALIKDVPM